MFVVLLKSLINLNCALAVRGCSSPPADRDGIIRWGNYKTENMHHVKTMHAFIQGRVNALV